MQLAERLIKIAAEDMRISAVQAVSDEGIIHIMLISEISSSTEKLQELLDTFPWPRLAASRSVPFRKDDRGVWFGYLILRIKDGMIVLWVYPSMEMAEEMPHHLFWEEWRYYMRQLN